MHLKSFVITYGKWPPADPPLRYGIFHMFHRYFFWKLPLPREKELGLKQKISTKIKCWQCFLIILKCSWNMFQLQSPFSGDVFTRTAWIQLINSKAADDRRWLVRELSLTECYFNIMNQQYFGIFTSSCLILFSI